MLSTLYNIGGATDKKADNLRVRLFIEEESGKFPKISRSMRALATAHVRIYFQTRPLIECKQLQKGRRENKVTYALQLDLLIKKRVCFTLDQVQEHPIWN